MSFQFGGQGAATVCIDNVMLGIPFAPAVSQTAVHVNQLAYFPRGAKQATVVTNSAAPLDWHLQTSLGDTLIQGETIVFGLDESSNLTVHLINFSEQITDGKDYTLVVELPSNEALRSYPFDISDTPYENLLYDAFRYFYYARSSEVLDLPYVGNEAWIRSAGPADTNVACWPESGCDYQLNVSRGWFDAGDYGKYTVNAGFSNWMLLNIYERGVYQNTLVHSQFTDTMNLPESTNGIAR